MGLMGGIGSLPLAGPAQTAGETAKTRIYLLETFYLKQGTQPGRINEWLSKTALPALSRVHSGPKIVLRVNVVKRPVAGNAPRPSTSTGPVASVPLPHWAMSRWWAPQSEIFPAA